MNKLFKLIAALRKGKKFQRFAPNNSDQVSSDNEDEEEDDDDDQEDTLTASEFESDAEAEDEPPQESEDKRSKGKDKERKGKDKEPKATRKESKVKGSEAKVVVEPKSKGRKASNSSGENVKVKAVETAAPTRGSHSVGGSSGSGRSQEQINFDHLMREIAELEAQVNLELNTWCCNQYKIMFEIIQVYHALSNYSPQERCYCWLLDSLNGKTFWYHSHFWFLFTSQRSI